MAAFGRSLCLFLTLWMTGSRTPTVIPPRLPESSPWWDQASLQLQRDALRLRKAGDFRAAEGRYQQGYREAVRLGDRLAAVRYLMSAGGCQLLAFEYRAALAAFLDARQMATSIQDHADLGAIAVNLSSLYLQMWDLPAATRAAEEGLTQMGLIDSRSTVGKPAPSYFQPYLLVQLGRIHAMLGDGQARTYFTAGIEAARARSDVALESLAWDLLGEEQLASGRLPQAETSFLEAFRLRRLFRVGELGFSYGHLGALALARNDLGTAEWLTQLALEAVHRGAPAWPEYLLLHQRGRIRLARGQVSAALHDFSLALDATARWRVEVLPARSSLISTNVALEQQIFHSFIQLAAEHAVQNGNPDWAARAFQGVELNRAVSLRESLALANVWRGKLPSEYWETLAQLGAQDAQRIGGGASNQSANRLRLKLTEMEAQAGFGLQPKKDENFRSRNSLSHFQAGLRDSELLLSFELGKKESYLWAVSRKSLRLYRLAAERDIAKSVQTFREAFPTGGPEAIRRGQELYQQLFGQLGARETRKSAWLLSLDGALFDIPFAALVTERQGGNTVYLVERHSLQTVPGALLLRMSADPETQSGHHHGEFLGVGDPIYNQVDPRWRGPLSGHQEDQLQRLVGSGDEVQSSAENWIKSGGTAVLLEGAQARRASFLRGLETQPAVIHLATHVLVPGPDREQAFIAFGLGDSSRPASSPEYLTTSEIAGLRVPGALVVMTGCATNAGEARAGAGLLGLTRAWLMAGASTVVSTAWPVEDTSGGMFARFYSHLRNHSAAEALQLSQREVAHSRTGREAPVSWASYQVTGGIH
jgi:CHAT domain-containing protein